MEVKKITGYDVTVRYTSINGNSVRTCDLCHIDVEDECYSDGMCEVISRYLSCRDKTAISLKEDVVKIEEIRELFRKGRRIPFLKDANHVILDCPNVIVDDEIYHLSLGIWRVPQISKNA